MATPLGYPILSQVVSMIAQLFVGLSAAGAMIGRSMLETRQGCALKQTLWTSIVDELLIAYQVFFHGNLAPGAETIGERGHL